jgi:ADP-dependent NAD(P)H-hydrate dehydratase / NAD(P)H-hydrate epimerase
VGDGLVVARGLAERGWDVQVWLAVAETELGPLALFQLQKLRANVAKVHIGGAGEWGWPKRGGIVIDALLGIGARGGLRGEWRERAMELRDWRRQGLGRVVALDIPSGLNEDRVDEECAIEADMTITFGFPKANVVREDKANWVGRIEVVPLGEGEFSDLRKGKAHVLDPRGVGKFWPIRPAMTHKGKQGRVVIVGGSPGFTGAPALVARGALRLGSGLVQIMTLKESYVVVASQAPVEVMVSAWEKPSEVVEACRQADAIVIGPGLGFSEMAGEVVGQLVEELNIPMVIDADAITWLSQCPTEKRKLKSCHVMTPHPGEMARWLGTTFLVEERERVVEAWMRDQEAGLILKGVRTIVGQRGSGFIYNTTGNAGLAKGGSGDVLAGMVGALLAQKMSTKEAMSLAVWLHGRGADIVVRHQAVEALVASEVADALGLAIEDLRWRGERSLST